MSQTYPGPSGGPGIHSVIVPNLYHPTECLGYAGICCLYRVTVICHRTEHAVRQGLCIGCSLLGMLSIQIPAWLLLFLPSLSNVTLPGQLTPLYENESLPLQLLELSNLLYLHLSFPKALIRLHVPLPVSLSLMECKFCGDRFWTSVWDPVGPPRAVECLSDQASRYFSSARVSCV